MKEIPTENQIRVSKNRGGEFATKWSAQTEEERDKLPQEIQDLKCRASICMFATHSGEMTQGLAMSRIEMAIEAAYNFGKTRAGKA